MADDRARTTNPVRPPTTLPARPRAVRVKVKTGRGGGYSRRRRWRDDDGTIYEWDDYHGTVEVYDRHGRHLGEIDPDTGQATKDAIPGRRIEP